MKELFDVARPSFFGWTWQKHTVDRRQIEKAIYSRQAHRLERP